MKKVTFKFKWLLNRGEHFSQVWLCYGFDLSFPVDIYYPSRKCMYKQKLSQTKV